MALDQRKYERKHLDVLRDLRPKYVRFADWLKKPSNSFAVLFCTSCAIYQFSLALMSADILFLTGFGFFLWLRKRDRTLAFKLPLGAQWKDKNNKGPGRNNKAEGILFLGNVKDTKEEVWFTNSDARTHVLYLGTTGSGKTEGLKSMVSNALTWGSGFIYVDGKADTDLWSSLSAMCRRLGRDDDLLVLNYMTGNSDSKAPSNTMNPFSSGSASYLTNMMVSLMPESGGDNAMWKERAVALASSIMPCLTWKREHQDIPMSVSTIRTYLTLPNVIKLSRDKAIPDNIRKGVKGYLDTLPGYIDDAYNDEGNPKPMGPDTPAYDTTTASQQHGYLSMQFTRSLQSLGDEYGYIFDTQAADVDMSDVVLNRRILIVLIPALEKSEDETANLGKIVAATLKGMMGSTLGSTVEGDSASVIDNKPTRSNTPFMVVFDEVGYYTAQGMAVMAAQARSLGFSLIYSAQDLPALEKRVKEEARSITANCNIKIFGKLEDPTQTKEFFEKTVGSALVMESTGFALQGSSKGNYFDNRQANMQVRARASYDGLRGFSEGLAVIAFGERVIDTNMYFSNPGFAKAMRVSRFIALPPPDENMLKNADVITRVRDLMVHKTWTAKKADVAVAKKEEITALADAYAACRKADISPAESGMGAVAGVFALHNPLEFEAEAATGTSSGTAAGGGPQLSGAPLPPIPPAAATPPIIAATLPPVAPLQPAAPPPAAAAPAEAGGNPMGFFAGKKFDADVETASTNPPPAAPVQEAVPEAAKSSGISWQDLVTQAGQQETPAAPAAAAPAQPAEKTKAQLDPETARILQQAGKDARTALTGETSDAAE